MVNVHETSTECSISKADPSWMWDPQTIEQKGIHPKRDPSTTIWSWFRLRSQSIYKQQLSERNEVDDLSIGRYTRFQILYKNCVEFVLKLCRQEAMYRKGNKCFTTEQPVLLPTHPYGCLVSNGALFIIGMRGVEGNRRRHGIAGRSTFVFARELIPLQVWNYRDLIPSHSFS